MKKTIGNKSSGWEYDEQNQTINIMDCVSTFDKLFKKKTGVTTLFLDQVEAIKIYYTNTPMPPFGQIGHYIYFKIFSKDGTTNNFRSYYGENSKRNFLETINCLSQKVEILDENHLLDAIRNDENIIYYIEKIEKEKK